MNTITFKTLLITGVALSPWILNAQSTETTVQTIETSTVTQSNPSSIPISDGPIGKGSTSGPNVLLPRTEPRPALSFQQLDLNGDGVLDQNEFNNAYSSPSTNTPRTTDPTNPALQPTRNADGSINPGAGWNTGSVTPAEYEAARAAAEAEGRTVVTPIPPSPHMNGSVDSKTTPAGTANPAMTPATGNSSTPAASTTNPAHSDTTNPSGASPQQPSSSGTSNGPSSGTRSGS